MMVMILVFDVDFDSDSDPDCEDKVKVEIFFDLTRIVVRPPSYERLDGPALSSGLDRGVIILTNWATCLIDKMPRGKWPN